MERDLLVLFLGLGFSIAPIPPGNFSADAQRPWLWFTLQEETGTYCIACDSKVSGQFTT